MYCMPCVSYVDNISCVGDLRLCVVDTLDLLFLGLRPLDAPEAVSRAVSPARLRLRACERFLI